MKRLASLAFLVGFLPALALAQQFPVVPDHSVIGRVGTGSSSGPSQAIPFTQFLPTIVGSQAKNTVFAGPTSGVNAAPAFRALVGSDLPAPGASSLGGVYSLTCSTSNWFNTLSTAGAFGCSQPNFTDLAGSIAGGQIPAGTITGTMIANTTITNANIGASAAIALSKLATQATKTIVGNNTGGSAVPTALTADQVGAILCAPNRQVFTSGTNATYTTPTCNSALPTRIEWEMVGGGGGGAGSGTAPAAATAGGNTCVNTSSPACTSPSFAANGGALGSTAVASAAGGTVSSCDIGIPGGAGGAGSSLTNQTGGQGGDSAFGGQGSGGAPGFTAGVAAATNSGSGGGGSGDGSTANAGGGGGAGGYCRKIQTSPATSYFYTVGTAGGAGGAGTSGGAGGAGAAGLIIATAYWQ